MTHTRTIAFLSLLLALQPPARAQTPPRYTVSLTGNRLAVADTQGGRPLMSPNSQTVLNGTPLPYSASVSSKADGFDLAITISNPSSVSQPLGCISLPGFRFGRTLSAFDFRHAADRVAIDHRNTEYWGRGFRWPSDSYSPVYVFGDAQTTVGVSCMYPFDEYRHEVELQLTSPGGVYTQGGRNWELEMKLLGNLPPGGQRVYTVAVRFQDGQTSDWIRTLAPYRDFFARTYGAVQYSRDPRPIGGFVAGNPPELAGPNNPYCYGLSPALRPDVVGFAPLANYLGAWRGMGYHRLMLWNPTGNYRLHPNFNFPFLFMTPLRSMPPAAASFGAMRALATPDFQMGYWWGNSTWIMRSWDAATAEPLDPANPEHVARAFAELDLATSLGATMIGLDAFLGHNTSSNCYTWLKMLRLHAPQVRFLVEGTYADVFHALGPAWLYEKEVTTPPILADFFVPGHETWAGIFYNQMAPTLGHDPTLAERRASIVRVTTLGYIAVPMDRVPLDQPYLAAQTWLTTIPADLRPGAQNGGGSGSGTTGSGATGGSGTTGAGGGTTTGTTGASGGGSNPGVIGTPLVGVPGGGGFGGGRSSGGGSSGGGGGGGGGGVSSMSGGNLGFLSSSAPSLSGGSGPAVVTVTGSGAPGGPPVAVTKGDRISSPSFSRAELEAAIERAKPKAFSELSPKPLPADTGGKPVAKPAPAKVSDASDKP